MDEIEFVDGLIVKPPHPNAPDFVKASISIKIEDLGKWLREKYKTGDEWVNIDVKAAKSDKWYAAVSTFKPKAKEEQKPATKGGSSRVAMAFWKTTSPGNQRRFPPLAFHAPPAPLRGVPVCLRAAEPSG